MKPKHVYNIVIQTTNALLWDAITNPDITEHYFFNLRVDSDWSVGSEVVYVNGEGEDIIRGEILEVNPISRVVYSFRGHVDEDGRRDPFTRVTFEIESLHDNACRLIVIHDQFDEENTTYGNVGGGWPTILSGLKTLLETGRSLELDVTNVACGGEEEKE
ncbi:MAG: SRPBCC family protein [Pseudomonadota bacterium]